MYVGLCMSLCMQYYACMDVYMYVHVRIRTFKMSLNKFLLLKHGEEGFVNEKYLVPKPDFTP